MTSERLKEMIEDLVVRMKAAAGSLEFEEAALLRDRIRALEKKELEMLS
jgi:excinuclease UvrABC helicase subunit UvrB